MLEQFVSEEHCIGGKRREDYNRLVVCERGRGRQFKPWQDDAFPRSRKRGADVQRHFA